MASAAKVRLLSLTVCPPQFSRWFSPPSYLPSPPPPSPSAPLLPFLSLYLCYYLARWTHPASSVPLHGAAALPLPAPCLRTASKSTAVAGRRRGPPPTHPHDMVQMDMASQGVCPALCAPTFACGNACAQTSTCRVFAALRALVGLSPVFLPIFLIY